MRFEPIDLTKNGNIAYTLQRWARNKRPFLSVVHVAFSGDYRAGSSGRPDAGYIKGVVTTARAAWGPSAMILDLRELRYEWGDEMDSVLQLPTAKSAFVLGPKCEPAISTLLYGINTKKSVLSEPNFFSDIGLAIDFVAQALVADWNSYVEQHPDLMKKTDLITLEDLQRS